FALSAQRVHEGTIDSRCRPRSCAPLIEVKREYRPELYRPEFPDCLGVLDIKAEEILIALTAAHRVESITYNGRTGIADAGVLEGPEQLGPFLRPRLEQPSLLRNAVAIGTAPLWPVGG